jgi:SMODS-associating 2TM, beta-strand rich effector domain
LWIAAILWFAILWLSGQGVSLNGLRLFASIPGIVLLFAVVFDRWAWRWPVMRRYVAQLPDVRGTWKGTIVTTWRSEDGAEVEPIPAFLVVRQTFTGIWARLLSERSASETVSAKLVAAADGVMTMAAVYRNTPRMRERAKSPMHFGALLVELHHDPVQSLVGHYWTDRQTGGDMEFTGRSKKLATDFEQTEKLTFSSQESEGMHAHRRRSAQRKASGTKPASRK